MRTFLFLLLPLICSAQTTNYPGALDTNTTLFVTSDNVQSSLSLSMAVGDNVAFVKSGTGFATNQIATICDTTDSNGRCTAFEHMLITGVNGQALTVTRGVAGTTAAIHAASKLVSVLIDAAHQKVLKDATIAIETALGANLSNVPGTSSGPVVPVNKGGTGVAAAQGNGSKVQLSTGSTTANNCTKFDSNGNTVDAGKPCNSSGPLNVQDFDFTAQTPGGTLSAGSMTITLTPCPFGVAGSDIGHYLYISGGTGSAEAVLITAGSCTSGAGSGTVTVTVANSHSASWQIQSATKGWQEAENNRNAAGKGSVYAPGGSYQFQSAVTYFDGATFVGDGDSTVIIPASSSANVFVNHNSQTDMNGTTGRVSNQIVFRSFLIDAASYTGVNSVYGIRMNLQNSGWINSIGGVKIDRVTFNNVRYAIYGERVYDVSISNIERYQNSAILITDTVGNPTYRNFNLRISNDNVSPTALHGTTNMALNDYLITLDKCIACVIDGYNVYGTTGAAGGIKATHATEGLVISNSSIEMFGALGNPFVGILLQERTWDGVTVSPSATQVSNVVVDMPTTVGLEWLASTFPATNLQVTNSLFTAHPTLGAVNGIEINGVSLNYTLLANNSFAGSFSGGAIWLAQAPANTTITGGQIQNTHASAACLKVDGATVSLAVTGVSCTATSGVPVSETYAVSSDRKYWANTGPNPIPDLLHATGAIVTHGMSGNTNAPLRDFSAFDSGTSTDFGGIAYNYKPTGLSTGSIDASTNGTALIQIMSAVSGPGQIRFRTGAANTAPTEILAITPQGLTPLAINLGTAPAGNTVGAGTQFYCTNCTTAATCTTGGSGHMAISNGTIWTCQ